MKKLKKVFGVDEHGFVSLPKKFSNVQISRVVNTDKVGGCSFCFPHGIDCTNSHDENTQRNWKKYRKTQYKLSSLKTE